MRGQTQRDATLRFQCGEWLRERSIGKIIRWVLGRRRGLLRGRLRLPLTLGKRQQIVAHGSVAQGGPATVFAERGDVTDRKLVAPRYGRLT